MKKVLLIGLIIGMLALTACGGNNNKEDIGDTYLGGSQGLKISFANGAPPDSVSDIGGEQSFDIIVDVENMGEDDVETSEALVSIVGFPPKAFNKNVADLKEVQPEEKIEGRQKNPDGTVIESPLVQVVFEDLAYQYAEPGNVQFPVIAEICYLYETNVASSLCIKDNLNKDEEDDFCKVSSSRQVSSSGAPVQVTRIQQSPAGKDKTRISFTVDNVGGGKIFKYDSENSCDNTKISNENKVWVEIENLLDRGADGVKCSGLLGGTQSDNGYVLLNKGNSADVLCTITMTERSDRLQPFNIKLTYDYFESIRKDIVVEYTPEYE